MKSTIMGYSIGIIIIITFLIVGSLLMNTNIKHNVNNSINEALYSTQRTLFEDKDSFTSNEQYLEAFNKGMKKSLNKGKKVEYKVDVYGVDYKKHLIDVKIKATYLNLYGQKRTITDRKAMIIDKEHLEE